MKTKKIILFYLIVTLFSLSSYKVLGQCSQQEVYINNNSYYLQVCKDYGSSCIITIYFEYNSNIGYIFQPVVIKKPDGSFANVITIANSTYVSTNVRTYTIPSGYFNVVGDWTLNYSTKTNCTSSIDKKLTLKVVGFTGNTIESDEVICSGGGLPTKITNTALASNSTFSIIWKSSEDGITWINITGATSQDYQPSYINKTTKYLRYATTSEQSCISTSNTVTKSVYSPFQSGTITGSQNNCYNVTPSQITQNTPPAGGSGIYSYQWYVSTDGSSFSVVPGPTFVAYQPDFYQGTRYFKRREYDSSCGDAYTNTISILGYPLLSAVVIGSSQTICYNTIPGQLNVTTAAGGGTGSYTYQWEESADGASFTSISGATGTIYQPVTLAANKWYRLKVINTCGNVYSESIKITVYSPFSAGAISGAQTICYNDTPTALSLKTEASGGSGTYSYQWEGSSDGSIFSVLSGATGKSYQPGALTTNTWYRLKVINSCETLYTNIIKVFVYNQFTPGSITAEQAICYNNAPTALSLTTEASGGSGSYTYQWEVSTDGSAFSQLTGATSTSYLPGLLTANTRYRLKVTNSCVALYTNSVMITVYGAFNPGTIQPDQTICYNSLPAWINPDAAPGGGTGQYTYQWEVSTNGTTWSSISGATSTSYLPGSLTTTTKYRRNTINACSSAYTNVVTISVRPSFDAGVITGNQPICYNTAPSSFISSSRPTGGTGSYEYQWQSSTDGSNWTSIGGATNESCSSGALTSTTYFRRIGTSGSCGSLFTNSVQVTVNQPLKAGAIKSSLAICYNTAPGMFVTDSYPSGGTGSYSYQWQKMIGTSWTDIQEASQETYTSGPLASTTYFKRVETSGSCGTVYSNQLTITVTGEFLPGVIGSIQTINYNTSPEEIVSLQTPSGGTGVYVYQWQQSQDYATWSNITGATSESYRPENLVKTTYFKRVITSEYCGTKESNIVTITVTYQLLPGSITADQTICFKTAPNLLTCSAPSGGTGLFSFQWMKSFNNTDWFNVEGEVGSSIQPGILTENTYFRRGVTSGANSSFSNSVKVTVYQPLNIPITDAKSFYCKGTSFQLSVLNPVYVSYKWYDSSQNYLQDGTKINVTNFSSDKKYYLKAVNSLGCFSDPVEIPLFVDNVHAGFTNDITTVALGSAVKFTSSSVNSNSVSWNFFEGDIIHETSPVHYYNTLKGSNSNKFDVKLNVVSPNGCLDSLLKKDLITVVNDVTGIESIEIVTFSYYPNPVAEKLYLSSSKRIRTVKIFTVSGNLTESLKFNEESVIIDLEQHKSGIYFLEINGAQDTKKIIKIIKQ